MVIIMRFIMQQPHPKGLSKSAISRYWTHSWKWNGNARGLGGSNIHFAGKSKKQNGCILVVSKRQEATDSSPVSLASKPKVFKTKNTVYVWCVRYYVCWNRRSPAEKKRATLCFGEPLCLSYGGVSKILFRTYLQDPHCSIKLFFLGHTKRFWDDVTRGIRFMKW